MPALVRPAVALEKAGIPTTLVVASTFAQLSDYIGETEGIRGLSIVSFPGVFNLETEETYRGKLTEGVLDEIIAGLTSVSTQKKKTRDADARQMRDIIYTGNFDEVNKFFFEKKWTDGLPIIPPTVERVEAFLKYTDFEPEAEITVLPPSTTKVTIWDIAVNGVMAGCKPEFMPVLIAIIEALADEDFNLRNINTSFGDVPFVVINGPVIKQLGFAHNQGAISLGPNPAVGRFLGLALRNMAGYRPGETYMGTWGYNIPFAIAEDEEESPWEPYHVEKGFNSNTSTVTLRATFNWGPQMSFNDVRSTEAGLRWLSNYAARIVDVHYPWAFSTTHFTMFLTPPTAKAFANLGMSKKDVVNYLWENTTTTVGDFHNKYLFGVVDSKKSIRYFLHKGEVEESIIREYEAIEAKGPNQKLRAIIKKEAIDIVVTGDRGRDKAQWFWTWYNYPVTREIKLPARWDDLICGLGKTAG